MLLKHFIPQQHVDTVYETDLVQLKKQWIRGIVTDLDNTLVGAGEPLASPSLAAWLDKVKEAGFRVIVVSNNHQTRVSRFAEPLALPYIYKAKKPTLSAFHKALQQLDLQADECVMIGDQLLTDVLGANRLGMYTILVRPIALEDEGFFTKINRKLERIIVSRLEKKGWVAWKN